MSDEHSPDDPSYDWLYTGRSEPPQSDPEEADHTRMLPRAARPGRPGASGSGAGGSGSGGSGAGGSGSGGSGAGPTGASASDSTRKIWVPPPPQPADSAGEGAPQQAASFGGTYPRGAGAAPPASPSTAPSGTSEGGPRYAQPTTARTAGPGFGDGPGGSGYAPPPQDPTYTTRAKPPRRRRRVRWVRIVVAVVAAWLVFLVVVPIYAWSKVSKVDAEPSGARPADGPGTTYLLVGSDSREGLTQAQKHDLGTGSASGQRTDTIIMLHVSSGSGPDIMLSIPRDSYVEVPGHGMNKINAAYAFGGPRLLVQTVERATHVKIDDYVEVGFTGVVNVVDAVGGITVCPKTSIHDPKAGNLTMKAGCQSVNGHVALDYSRSRAFPLGDITRAFHQREVIAATGSKAASWQTVVFPWRYWDVSMAGADSVQVGNNVGPVAFARFAWAMAHSSGTGTKRCVVPFSSLGTSTPVGSVVTWDHAKATAIFNDIKTDNTAAIHCQGQ